jgi:hypothetical protein
VLGRRRCRARSGRNVGCTQRPLRTATSRTSPSRKVRFSSQPLDFAWNFPPGPISRMTFRWSVLRMICRESHAPFYERPAVKFPGLLTRFGHGYRAEGMGSASRSVRRSAAKHSSRSGKLSDTGHSTNAATRRWTIWRRRRVRWHDRRNEGSSGSALRSAQILGARSRRNRWNGSRNESGRSREGPRASAS